MKTEGWGPAVGYNNNNNSNRFMVPHQVCLPGSRSKTVRAMRCEPCMLLLENHSMPINNYKKIN